MDMNDKQVTRGTTYSLEVHPRLPPRLARLEELAGNLWYSWDRATRALFARLDPEVWEATGHSPKALLKRIDQQRLVDAAADPIFLSSFHRVLSAFDTYHSERFFKQNASLQKDDLVAYFCAEFGFHESFPIYSGGLGILAGDHCKAASDHQLPFIAMGLLYRQGYFVQSVDAEGNQRAEYHDAQFDNLPIAPVRKADGAELMIELPLPGRSIRVKVWQARVGHVSLYLLDCDVTENRESDRFIAHRLYGGDRTTRLEQEIVLGMGGVRAIAAMGLRPSVWHINEGHAAFLVLERMRYLVLGGLSFETALEAVASNTVFTTHTAVPAGHDHFSDQTIRPFLEAYCSELRVPADKVAALGRSAAQGEFNMTTLAVRGSRYQNGVSRIHAGVSSRMLADLWPQIAPEENPIRYITNGVHIPTFLAPEWGDVFDRYLGIGWLHRLEDPATLAQIDEIPDHVFWSVRQTLKTQMLHMVRHRVRAQHFRNHGSEAHLERLLRCADPNEPNVLTIGFARRFATYKRAMLLFNNLDALRQVVGEPGRPVLFLFAGKAHPADEPGQELIRAVARVARMPEFEGKVLLIEGYDLHLARRLVTGVDIWLNNPVYPLEACGTSGMKAGMNGVINLSVLDGWWDEGYEGDNGWAIKPAPSSFEPEQRDGEEAHTLYEILQDHVLPLYYENRGSMGYSEQWVRRCKRSMASLLPRFNASRMLNEYVSNFYVPASRQGWRHADRDYAGAQDLAAWKARVRAAWPGVSARRIDTPKARIGFGEAVPVEIGVKLNGLGPSDVAIELLLARKDRKHAERRAYAMAALAGDSGSEERRFGLELKPELCGRLEYRVRVYPKHPLLTHAFEMGLVLWL
jgi:starch phosphorylase